MIEIGARVQRVIEELTGNEALLETLETEAATELLNWGIELATSLVKRTEGMDEAEAEQVLLQPLKAVRQTMRSVGNWAAGRYIESESRVHLRNKLLENFKLIFGEEARLPSPEKMDQVLNRVDDKNNTPHQLILKLKQSLEEPG